MVGVKGLEIPGVRKVGVSKIRTDRMRESTIEKEVCKYAESLGWLQYKFLSPNVRGIRDRMFMRGGMGFFIEFKKTFSEVGILH